MISKSELLQGRDQQYPDDYTQEISYNLDKLLIAINQVRSAYGIPMTVNSGWRPASINNSTPGAAAHSKHMLGLAVDISDPNGELWKWVLQHLDLMAQLDFFFEDKRWTPGWVHFGLGKSVSGKRIFVPNANRATTPNIWDGIYDHQYDV
jgi:Peptidase M15